MAILILGRSTCGICKKVISDHNGSYSFPAFISNPQSKYNRYNDPSFHRECLLTDADAYPVMELANIFRKSISPKTRVCAIDGKPVGPDEEYIFLEYVTDNELSFLHRHVFSVFRLSNLAGWFQLQSLVKSLDDLKFSEKNMSKYADKLLKKIDQLSEQTSIALQRPPLKTTRYHFSFPGLNPSKTLAFFSDAVTARAWFINKLKTIIEYAGEKLYIDLITVTQSDKKEISFVNDSPEDNKKLTDDFLRDIAELSDVDAVVVQLSANEISDKSLELIFRFGFNASNERSIKRLPEYEVLVFEDSSNNLEFLSMLAQKMQAKQIG
jgi:hypothetical protein